MGIISALPPELRVAPGNLGAPVVAAAFVPSGILVVAAQRSVTVALAHLDGVLGEARVRVATSGEHATLALGRTAPLPDGRMLLCSRGPGPNLYVDTTTLDTTPATELVGAVPANASLGSERDVTPRDAFVVGGRLVVAHGAHYGNSHGWQRFSEVPAAGAPVPWVHDLAQRLRAYEDASWWRWEAHRSAVVGDDGLVLAGQELMRSGSTDHALVALGADRTVRRVVRRDRTLIRDEALALVADRGRLLVAATGVLEVLDGTLDPVAAAPAGHPFTTAFRLLAGDGAGRLLWYDPQRYLLMLTAPEELAHDAPGASLDRLAAEAARAEAPAKPARTAARKSGPKAKQVTRHTLDTALVDELARERRRELLELLEDPTEGPAVHKLAARAEDVLAHASVFDRDDPVVWQAVRALAQGWTADVVRYAAMGAGAETVDVPFADRIVTVPSKILTSVSPLSWCDAWYAAAIAGETRCLDLLDALGDDEVGAGGRLRHGLEMKHALQAYRSAPASVLPHVEAAVAASGPESFRTSFQARAQAWRTAVYPLLLPLVADDAAGFDTALLAALKAHQKFFGSKSESHALRGWVALGPQAMCCLAQDRGIEPTVESEYLIPALTQRRFASS